MSNAKSRTKTCKSCGREQPINQFALSRSEKSERLYRNNTCRECANVLPRKRRATSAAKIWEHLPAVIVIIKKHGPMTSAEISGYIEGVTIASIAQHLSVSGRVIAEHPKSNNTSIIWRLPHQNLSQRKRRHRVTVNPVKKLPRDILFDDDDRAWFTSLQTSINSRQAKNMMRGRV